MDHKRREFIKLAGNLAGGFALTPFGCKLMPKEESASIDKFGIQLYSLRDDLPKDPKGVLKQVADAGYKQIESYQHAKLGMFWGMSNTEIKKYMDELGMTIVSSHCEIDKDFEKKAAEAAAIGMKYLIFPHEGPKKTIDDYKRYADDFNKKGEICKKNGIRFAFHNHEYSFIAINGEIPQTILMQNCDPSLVDFEIDIYWVVTAKQDPEAWLKKYKDRFKLCHVKDRIKGATEREASCTLGEGSIDFPKILKTAKENGMQYYIVEQERYDNTTPLKSAAADAEYMRKLKV